MLQAAPDAGRVIVVTPVYNDWESVGILIQRLATLSDHADGRMRVVVVDDGSTGSPAGLEDAARRSGLDVRLLTLVRNLGHQRAIAVGLCHAVTEMGADRVVVMDADGEDRPEDVPRLLHALQGTDPLSIVVAERHGRSEGWLFVLFYRIYRLLFSMLTGIPISFGNFCAMRSPAARRLIAMHELLLHLPATVIRSRCPIVRVATDRGSRYAGQSKMNLISLVVHGMSAVAVFSERTFTRLLVFAAGVFGLATLATVVAMLLKLLDLASPGWLTTVAGVLMIVLVQSASVALSGLFVVLNNKRDVTLLPHRATADLIGGVTDFDGAEAPRTVLREPSVGAVH